MLAFFCLTAVTIGLLVLSRQRFGRIWWSLVLPFLAMLISYLFHLPTQLRAALYVAAIFTVVVLRWLAIFLHDIKNNNMP